ncbi:MAG: threonine-phosphate decarboxylase [Hydrogenophilales bacterium 17-61-9]|nr:MAG: threonine-phosphate decarboxylase [Hydrogenophilales bacterium 17-61-9]
MLEHGGKLLAAAARYGIEAADWLDLSTGINPAGWPLPPIPPEVWQRLPEREDGLVEAAAAYYGCGDVLPVAGSQAAIQALPQLRAASRVGVPHPAYAEHAHAWRSAGHAVTAWQAEQGVGVLDVLVLVHPNNPAGQTYSRAELLDWHAGLAARGGWLVVDEAFVDATPEASLAGLCPRPGLIVLRSLGKFFGLAGARVGFVLAEPALLGALDDRLGPWAVSAPARWVARAALADSAWQQAARPALLAAGARLAGLLRAHGLAPAGGTALFQWVRTSEAADWHERLARQGILTRLFADPPSLRFGLPHHETDWARLAAALSA